ncbi:MAG: hypothetical protein KDB03_26915, partial [Planctomycetales bacterium]|nr:hypothetical protein [Planctomycetales bacterium]
MSSRIEFLDYFTFWKIWPLSAKLQVPLLLVNLVASLLILWGSHALTQSQINRRLESTAGSLTHIVSYVTESILDADDLQRVVATMGAEADIEALVVLDVTQKKVLASNHYEWFNQSIDSIAKLRSMLAVF